MSFESPIDRLDQIAERHGDLVAASSADGRRLTFAELQLRSDRAASLLLRSGRDAARPVAIMVREVDDLLVAIFGAWKAGTFFSIVDPSLPRDRIDHLMSNLAADVVLGDDLVGDDTISGGPHFIRLDSTRGELDSGPPPRPSFADSAIGSILVTSGSEGRPKCIVRPMNSLMRSVDGLVERGISRGPGDRVGLTNSFAFAGGMSTVFKATLKGATLCHFKARERNLLELADWIESERVNKIQMTPSLFRHLALAIGEDHVFHRVVELRLGGDVVMPRDIEYYHRHFRERCVLHIGFGSSESATVARTAITKETKIDGPIVPVGRPPKNVRVWIEGEDGQPLAVGESGEIVVSSDRVCPGQWNGSGVEPLFPEDPERPGCRICRTGDMGRFDREGLLYFLGRKDQMLKVRGHRVEPAEIESMIFENREVDEVAVVGSRSREGDTRLVAWVATRSDSVDPGLMRRALARRLPEYMVPERIEIVPDLPRNQNGKIDRTALSKRAPLPRTGGLETHEAHEKGHGSETTEDVLLSLWQELMEDPSIGKDDRFFERGGNSILAARLFAEVEKTFGARVPISSLMEFPTVATQAELIDDARNTQNGPPLRAVLQLTNDGSSLPVFFFSGRGGELLFLRDVVAALPENFVLFGVRGIGMDGGPLPPPNYEEIASLIVDEIRSVYPEGPLVLAGHSSGGPLALEVGLQLEDREGQAPPVIAVDSPGWPMPRSLASRAIEQMIDLVRRPKRLPSYLGALAYNLRLRLGLSRQPGRSPDAKERDRFWPVEHRYGTAARTYVPRSYHGKVTLVIAEDGMFRHAPPNRLGWEQVAVGGLEVVRMAGNHVSVIGDHPTAFADFLRRQVDSFAAQLRED